VPGYPYSPALAKSGIVWNDATLDKWLTNPEQYVRGAAMPMALSNPAMRRDIIAYLKATPARNSATQTVKLPPG
jgi:cytochrome c